MLKLPQIFSNENKRSIKKKIFNFKKKNILKFQLKILKLINYIKKKNKIKKKFFIALYYPSNYEFNILKIISNFKKSKAIFLLPKIQNNNL